jgi:exosortase
MPECDLHPAPITATPDLSRRVEPARTGWNWRSTALALGLGAAAVAITRDVWRDMLYVSMTDEESSYILMVPVVIAILVWTRRKAIQGTTIIHTWMGTVLLAVGWAAWSTGYRTGSHALWYGGTDLMLLGAVVTALGTDALRRFFPAVCALVFLIPVVNGRRHQISGPLELMTAEITRAIAELFGMNIQRQGNLLTVNGVEVTVAEACNGMRMVFTLVLVCYLYAFAAPMRWYGRVLVLVLSPGIAMICNVTRLVPTAWVYGHASVTTANRFHDISGWVMLGVGFALLTGIGRAMRPKAVAGQEA